MKILQVNKYYYPWRGGIETVVKSIAAGLTERGHVVDVLVCQPKGGLLSEQDGRIAVHAARTLFHAFGMPVSWDFMIRFRRLIRQYDLVFLHHPFPLGMLAYLLFGQSTAMVVWYHSDIVRQRFSAWLFAPFLKAVLHRARVIMVSTESLRQSSEVLQPYLDKVRVVPFGMDVSVAPTREEDAQIIYKRWGNPLVLSVGRLVYYKGYEYLINAMQYVEGSAVIIGEGPLLASLQDRIARLGLASRVFIVPPVKNLSSFFQAADVFVLPSSHCSEAFGLVQVEAMAHGLPVINTLLSSGVAEVSVHGVSGLSVPPADSRSLARAITSILSNPDLKQSFSTAARIRAQEVFPLNRFISDIETVLDSIV